MTAPRLSVIVPAHRSPRELERSIAALRASDLDPRLWELIVVDDGSADIETDRVAQGADRVVSLPHPPRGPAAARNAGAAAARGDVLAFVDADVLVHRDALSRMRDGLERSGASAIFGSYDDSPEAGGVVSQYRNLLHHRVHQRNAGDAESFWAGCGAVDRIAFESVDGFDADRFRRPEMEDVELGYRLRDAGHRIVLDPMVLCTHIKRWSLGGMLSSDFARRGVPWARLLVERNTLLDPKGLSLGPGERASAALAFLSALSAIVSAVLLSPGLAILAVVLFLLFIVANAGLFAWFRVKRGILFTLPAIPLHFAYSVNAVIALVAGTALELFSSPGARARYIRRR